MPTFEKEVAFDSSNPSTPTDGKNMPFRMRNTPADSRAGPPRLDTNSLTTIPTNVSQASSIPASPSASYRGKAPDAHYRNPAFDPRGVAARVFGGSPHSEASNPTDNMYPAGPPKPVGFAYNPRDLRNAMLNRAAAENAAASNSRNNSPAPASAATYSGQISHPFGGAVELPAAAVPHKPSYETLSRDSTTSRTSEGSKSTNATGTFTDFKLPDPKPVELSATPSTRKPLSPSTSQSHKSPELAVRENITMPVVEPPRASRPPPPPPKDEPKSPVRSPPVPAKEIFENNGKQRKASLEPASPSSVRGNAPTIGDLPGLREGNGSGLDLGLKDAENKPPAWL